MPKYRRVSNSERPNNKTENSRNVQSNPLAAGARTTKTRSERASDKIHAAIWVGTAVLVAKYTDFMETLLTDPDIIRPLYNLALTCIGINTVLTLYLIVYLPKFKGVHNSDAWQIYCPRVIPTMTVFALIASVLLIRATWPVWGFFSPLILGIEAFGFLFSLHFVPWF